MTKAFAGVVAAFSIVMLAVQVLVADSINVAVVAFWILVGAVCVYVLFFKKPARPPGD